MKTASRVILSLLLALLVIGSFHFSQTPIVRDKTVNIEAKGSLVYMGGLGEDRKITIKASYGLVRIQIKSRKVAVLDAECPDHLCVKAGWHSQAGESIRCEANELVIQILGRGNPVSAGDVE